MAIHKFIVVVLLSTLALSCASTNMGKEFDTSYIDQIVKGKTTENDVIQHLGQPTSTLSSAMGTKTIIYSYTHAEKVAFGDVKTKSQRLQVDIGKDGKVTNYTYINSNH